MPMTSLTNLLLFCSRHNIKIHPSLQFAHHEEEDRVDSIGVFLRDDVEGIPEGTPVVSIPKSAVLSVKSTELFKHLKLLDDGYLLAPCGIGTQAQLELVLAMLIEERNGPTSPWYHYLRSLPRKRVDLPILWSLALHNEDREEVEDKKTALAWLRGTEVERQLHSGMGSGSSMSLDDLNGFFNGFVLPITKNTNIEEFYRAYSFVSSRAFVVDAYHGLAMVPVADAFNHATYNHVQLESEFDVCPECGSVQECVHDKDQGENTQDSGVAPVFEEDSNEDEKYYLMTTTTHIPVGTKEIFNTYGSRLTNAALMVQYGFILDENEKDYIEFDLRDVVEEEGMDKPVGIGRGSGGIGEPLEGLEEVTYHSEDFQINSDGRMSTALFALLGGDPGKAIQLCQTRLARFTQDDVGTVLDELPSSRWRTRMVGMEVLAEQGILRSCMTGWQDYLGL